MRSVPRQMVARSPHVPSPGGEVPGAEGPSFLPAHPPMMPTQRRQPLRARQSCHDSWMDPALPVGAQARSPPRHRPLAPPARAALGSPLRDTKLARPSRRLRGTSPRGRGTVAHSQSPAHVTGLPRGRDSRRWSQPHVWPPLPLPPSGWVWSRGRRDRRKPSLLRVSGNFRAGLTSSSSCGCRHRCARWGGSHQLETRRERPGRLSPGPPNRKNKSLICLSRCGWGFCHFRPEAFLSGTPPIPTIQGDPRASGGQI